MLILALAPLAIPFLALTAVFVLPLLLPVLALGLIGVIVAAPILLVRRLGRRVRPKPETRTAPRGGAVRGSVAGRRATG
jgi:hypothetical protein